MAVYIPGHGDYVIEVNGESQFQGSLELACGGRRRHSLHFRTTAELVIEGPDAVRVQINDHVVGYLTPHDAACYYAEMDRVGYAGAQAVCEAMIVGGWDRGDGDVGMFGVKLDLPQQPFEPIQGPPRWPDGSVKRSRKPQKPLER